MFLFLVASFVIGLIGFWYYNYLYYYGHLKKIPSPSHLPLLGNLLHIYNVDKFLEIVPRLMAELKSNSVRLHLPTETMVVTKDYNLIEHVLSSPNLIDKGFQYNFFRNFLGSSVLTTSGQQWRSRRKMLTPTFHFKILEQFHDVFNANGAIMIKKLQKEVGVPSFNVTPYITLCNLDVICETAMGTSINAQLETDSAYVTSLHRIGQVLPARIVNPLYHSNFLFSLSALGREEQRHLKVVLGYHDTVIQSRRKQFLEEQKQKGTNKEEDDLGRKKKVPFLDLLFQATIDGQPLTDTDISNEVATFMVAGHDTTAAALSFALYALGDNKNVQDKAFEELRGIFGDDKQRLSTLEDIQEMKYLELIVKETLRLYPSAPIYSRKIKQDFTCDGITYPKGTTITIMAYAIHHDENQYQNAERFDPDRFSKEKSDGKRPYAFIPFSAGPRNCIGQKFAMLQLKTLLSTILRNFEVKSANPPHKLALTPHIILKSTTGVNIALSQRIY